MRQCFSALCLSLLPMIALGTAAGAADLQPGPDPYPVPQSDTWTGIYLGVHGDKVWSEGGIELDKTGGFLIPLDVENGLFYREKSELRGTFGGGLTAGYNQQLGQFVIGVEADFTSVSLNVKHERARIDPNPMIPFNGQLTLSEYETEFDTLSTVRLRAGWSLNNTLIYLTAGLAAGEVENSFAIALPGLGYSSPDWSESGLALGYALGGGVEHKLTRKISVKAEALMVDLEDRIVKGSDPVSFPGESISYRFDNKMVIGRVGLNYAF